MANKELVIIGLDLSANGAGLVALSYSSGEVIKTGYITNQKQFLDKKEIGITAFYLQPRSGKKKNQEEEDKDTFISRRRNFIFQNVVRFIGEFCFNKERQDILVCLEDYAVQSQSTGLLEMAEISGLVRNYLWEKGLQLRLHDPLSVKMWATGNGFAKKVHMVDAAIAECFDVPTWLLSKGNKFKDPLFINNRKVEYDYSGPGTDIADAFHLARLGRQEIRVRVGEVPLEGLVDHQRKIYLRVTKSNPINLLAKPFIVIKEK
jgi:hypothetical protein